MLAAGLILCLAWQGSELTAIPAHLLVDTAAVVTLDETHFQVFSPSVAELRVTQEITVLGPAGKHFGRMALYYDSFSRVSLQGEILNAAGVRVKSLKKGDIKDRAAFTNNFMDDLRLKWAQLYHTEYPYTLRWTYKKSYKGLVSWPKWRPVPHGAALHQSRFTLSVPANMKARFQARNLEVNPVSLVTDGGKTYSWRVDNLTEAQAWAQLRGGRNRQPMVLTAPARFEIADTQGDMSTWLGFGDWYHRINQGRGELSPAMKQRVAEAIGDLTDPETKARAIYKLLKQHTRYISIQLGLGGWQSMPATEVDALGYGDCKALTTYTIAMLGEAGLKAWPALIYLGEDPPEIDPDFPANMFNHVVVYLPLGERELWLEATSDVLPFGQMSVSTGDRYALVVQPGASELKRTPLAKSSETLTRGRINLEGEGHGRLNLTLTGHFLDEVRFRLADRGEAHQQRWLTRYLGINDFKVIRSDFPQLEPDHTRWQLPLELALPNLTRRAGSQLRLRPNLCHVLERPGEEPLGVLPAFPGRVVDELIYLLPEGWHVPNLPEPIIYKTEFATYRMTLEIEGSGLLYKRELSWSKLPTQADAGLVTFLENVARADRLLLTLRPVP